MIICLEAASAELRAQTVKLARHRGGHRSRSASPPRSTVLVALPLPRVGTRRRRRLSPLVVQMISQLSGQPAFQGHSSSKAGSRPSVPVITAWIIPCVVEALIPRKGEGSCPRLGGALADPDRPGGIWGGSAKGPGINSETLRDWVRQVRIDVGEGPGTTRCGGPVPPGAGVGGPGAWGRGRDPLGRVGFSPVVECERPSR